MANWYYYNEKGEKITVTGGQLKGLAKAGVITPETVIETVDGKSAPARKVKGLTFQTTALPEALNPFTATPHEATNPPTVPVPTISQTASQAIPPSVATPVAVESKSSLLVTIIGIVALLIVGGIGWSMIEGQGQRLKERERQKVTTEEAVKEQERRRIAAEKTAAEQERQRIATEEQERLRLAAEQVEIDRFCAKYGNDVKAIIGRDTLLHKAAGSNDGDDNWNVAVANYLVSKGANVNAKDIIGRTPLHWAVVKRRVDVAKFLVSKGADVNARDNNGQTPIINAMGTFFSDYGADGNIKDGSEKLRIELALLLVSNGADVNAKDKDGRTPLHYARLVDVAEFLVSNGADINARDNRGLPPPMTAHEQIEKKNLSLEDMPLHTAVLLGDISLVQSVVAIGASVHTKDEVGNTPLHYAVQEGDFDIVQFLVSNGANVNAKNEVLASPLFYAASYGNLKIVQFLVSMRADVNARSDSNLTPLHVAAIEGHTDIARFLVSRGAFVNASDVHDNTPLDFAIGKQHIAMIEYLRSVGGHRDIELRGRGSGRAY